MAITDANLSQLMAAGAAAVTFVSPPHTAVLALGAALMGLCGNYRQEIANDPPRDDFDEVWVSTATLDESLLQTEERLNTCQRFAATQMMLSDALLALLRALERHDGAVNAGNSEAAAQQAAAARQNADKVNDLQASLSVLGASMNEAIASLRQGAPSFDALTLEQVQETYRSAWGRPPDSPAAPLAELVRAVSGTADDLLADIDVTQAHPILAANELPPDRTTPFEAEYLAQLATASSPLRDSIA